MTGGFSFSITNTSGAQTVTVGQTATYDLNVTPSSGTFLNPVVLKLSGCPLASTCLLSSAQIPAGSGTTSVVLTIATSAGTTVGTYSPITITGTSGSANARASLSLTVQSSAFGFSMSNSGPATIAAGSSGKYDITVTPSVGTFPNVVALSFTGCPATSTCSLSSVQVAAGSGTTDVFLAIATAAGTPTGPYSITVIGTSGSLTENTTISLMVQAGPFSFSMSSAGPPAVAVGSSARFDVTIKPSSGSFPNPVVLSFTPCPSVITCSLSSAQVAAGAGTSDVFLTIATMAPARRSQVTQTRITFYALWLPFPGVVIVSGIGSARARWKLQALLVLLMLALCSGCGGLQGGSAAPARNPGTPPGTYTVTVIGTSGSLTANTTISLTVQTAQ